MRITSPAKLQPAATEIPDAIARPKLALWLWERGLDYRQAGDLFGCSHTWVLILCKPFDDPDRRRPKQDQLERIVRVTQGEVTAADFYPPHLRAGAPTAEERAGDAVVLRQGRAS